MTLDDVYSIIRTMDEYKKVHGNSMFYGIGDYDVISFEYHYDEQSGINIVCPHDKNGDFMYVEVSGSGLSFTKIYKGGSNVEVMDFLNDEDRFFQENTITDLVFSLDEYKVLLSDFMRYYNGFLRGLTVYL